MASRKVKNVRRSSSLSYFSSYTSCARLRRLQALLKPQNDRSSEKPDAVLCILGIDSRFDEGHRDLAEYLLFDYFEGRDGIDDEDETFEDIVILVTRTSVQVYCSPYNYSYLLPYVAHWPNLRLHCLNRTEYEEDEDLAENFKILSFIGMCKDSASIGMTFGTRARPQLFDPFLIEKWPLIQASALDDFGGGGFFTMKHEIINLNEPFWRLCDEVDLCMLEVLLTKKQPLFEKQWNNMLTNISLAFSSGAMQTLTESIIVEPLESFYNYGNLLSHGSVKSSSRKPHVLFGQNSSTKGKSSPASNLGRAGIRQSTAKHMVCQAVSSKSPLICARTYFLASGHMGYPLSGGIVHAPRPPKTDIDLLERIYKVVITSVLAAIDVYGETLSVTKAEAVCLEALMSGFKESVIPSGLELLKSRELIQFSMHGLDTNGSTITLQDDCSSALPKVVSLCVHDVPSIEETGETLGSVEFAETFVESRINVKVDESISSVDHTTLILTASFPRVQTWEVHKRTESVSKMLSQFTLGVEKPFGDLLVDGVSCSVVGSQELSRNAKGNLSVCEEGILFLDSANNLATFPMSYIEELQLYDRDSSSAVSMLCVTYRHSLQHYLPLPYHSAEDMVVFVFTPKTKAYRAFYSEVVSRWQKRKSDPVLKLLEVAPEYAAQMYGSLQFKYEIDSKVLTTIKPIQQAAVNMVGFDKFMDHLTVSNVFRETPISITELPYALKQRPTEPTQAEVAGDMIVVSLLTGQPGSHQEELCSALVSMAKEQNRWMIMKPPLTSAEPFTAKTVHDSLTAIYTAARKQRQTVRAATGGRKKMRVLLVVPSFTSIVQVVQAIESHPNPEVAKRMCIGAVTACVDPLNFFIHHRLTFPMLLDQCAQGWVNNILFTGSTDTQNLDMAFCQEMLRKVNSNVAFILAEKGEIRRSTDAELIVSETAFVDPDIRRARHLLTPGWSESDSSVPDLESFNQVSLEFYQPLDRTRLVNKLKYLKQALQYSPLDGNVYHVHGRTKFTGSDQIMEVYYTTLSDYLSITEVPEIPSARPPSSPRHHPSPPGQANSKANGAGDGLEAFHFVFVGCALEESTRKTWLRGCAKQKPQKKSLKSNSSLSSQERTKIQVDHHLDPLPQGWFYNGSQYVSMAGERQSTHPDLESFTDKFIDEANENIDTFNKKMETEPYYDLFDKPHTASSVS